MREAVKSETKVGDVSLIGIFVHKSEGFGEGIYLHGCPPPSNSYIYIYILWSTLLNLERKCFKQMSRMQNQQRPLVGPKFTGCEWIQGYDQRGSCTSRRKKEEVACGESGKGPTEGPFNASPVWGHWGHRNNSARSRAQLPGVQLQVWPYVSKYGFCLPSV